MWLLAQEAADDDLAEALEGLTADDWIRAGLIVVGAVVLSRLFQLGVTRFVRGEENAAVAARLVGRFVGFVVVLVGLIYALNTLEVRVGPLLGALGIGGLALAFAAQSILENFFSSILIQARRPFRIGDQVVLGDGAIEGVVEDVNFRVVIIKTFDGERVLMPSSQVIQNPIVNVTARGPWRTTLQVGVTYGTDLPTAQRVLLDATREVDGVLVAPPPEVWFEAFGDSSLDLVIRFWHTPEMATRWRVRSAVGMAAKQALDAAGIEIPFPQRTVWFGAEERQEGGGT
jgi:small conductance mechanosensitive channel